MLQPETGAVAFRSRFLLVSHQHVVCMTPVSEVQSGPASAQEPALTAAAAGTLAADMHSLLTA